MEKSSSKMIFAFMSLMIHCSVLEFFDFHVTPHTVADDCGNASDR